MQSAYDTVTSFLSKFTSAGRNIVTSIADGIKGAVGKVTGAISNVTQKIRDFLPFSPAKEGALRDIMDTNISGSLAESIRKDDSPVKQMKALTDSIADEAQMDVSNRLRGASYNFGGLMPQVTASQVVEHNNRNENRTVIDELRNQNETLKAILKKDTNFNVDGQTLAQATANPMDSIMADRFRTESYMRGDR